MAPHTQRRPPRQRFYRPVRTPSTVGHRSSSVARTPGTARSRTASHPKRFRSGAEPRSRVRGSRSPARGVAGSGRLVELDGQRRRRVARTGVVTGLALDADHQPQLLVGELLLDDLHAAVCRASTSARPLVHLEFDLPSLGRRPAAPATTRGSSASSPSAPPAQPATDLRMGKSPTRCSLPFSFRSHLDLDEAAKEDGRLATRGRRCSRSRWTSTASSPVVMPNALASTASTSTT